MIYGNVTISVGVWKQRRDGADYVSAHTDSAGAAPIRALEGASRAGEGRVSIIGTPLFSMFNYFEICERPLSTSML